MAIEMFFTEAQNIVLEQAHSFGKEVLPLGKVFGRVLGEKIIADRDYPPFNRAAMDGYALRYEDFEKGVRSFTINETIFAGQIPSTKLSAGECYKIMTGAATPSDADIIIRREDTEEQNGTVSITINEVKQLQNIALRGEDLHTGDHIMDKAMVATPAIISMLAAIGKNTVQVEKLPRVAIITTGNEVIPIDQPVNDVQIRNSNAWLLQALLAKNGIVPFSIVHMPDERAQLQQAFRDAMQADIIISCGGVSAGDADFVPEAAQAIGAQQLFHKVMIRPGKPIWCGKLDQKMIFALPGNPLSTMVTFTLFVQPFLNACYGLPAPLQLRMTMKEERVKKNTLDEFFPAKIIPGTASVQAVPFNGSGDIRTAIFADGIALHPRDKLVLKAGDMVDYISLLS